MTFLGFIKNRQAQPSVEQQSETAKQMYSREAIEDKANRVVATPDQEKRAKEIGNEISKPNQPTQALSPAPIDAPSDQGSNTAHLQNQSNQDKTQEALSPTDSATGKTAVQEKSQTQETTTEHAKKTIARPAPSWER
jgi:hypothetical protein